MTAAVPSRRALLAAPFAVAALSAGSASAADTNPAMQAVLDYAQAQKTTGFLVVRDGAIVVERNWPLGADAARFRANFVYGTAADGALLEDVASQQKSFVAILAAIAADKGLLDVEKPVAAYAGAGWSKAALEQEARIRVAHLLTMSSGLDVGFAYAAPPGTVFLYNTPVYATLKRVLAAAAGASLEAITRDWLTVPAGMKDTAWRKRPAAFGDVGNPTGLVTTPRDAARLGQLVLDRGRAQDGRRVVSEAQLDALFARSAANPAYGRLWWLNGGAYAIRPPADRVEGPLIPAAPADLVAALGALDRKLYIVPSRRLVVVRTGQAAPDPAFDQQLWLRLAKALA
jgi:CubicO group peptidase (beta-lactamase class C family)